jgi:dTMP kinase
MGGSELFVTFEGVEGSGKSTQAALLCRRLEADGLRVVAVEEPGGTELGQRVREIVKHARQVPLVPRSEVLLFLASRAQLVQSVVRPALADGAVVVCDRFSDSTYAYQCYGRGLDLLAVRQANEFAVEGLHPDLTILLDLAPDRGLGRKPGGEDVAWDRFEREEIDFHRRVRDGYLELASQEPGRWHVVDACQPVAQIAEQVLSRVKSALELKPSGGRR